MKKIGLIGGTGPESTILYYHDLVYGVQKQLGTDFFPELVIESLSVFRVLEFCRNQDYKGLSDYLLAGIKNLAAAGAHYGALTGITPHIVFEELSEKSPISLVSMVETAREASLKRGFKKICLLGTLPTMEGTFFQDSFAAKGIEVVVPSKKEREYIGSKIETELEYGKVIPSTKEEFASIAERIAREEGAEAIVLGCTELPLIFRDMELPVPYLDVMQIHIDALVALSLSE